MEIRTPATGIRRVIIVTLESRGGVDRQIVDLARDFETAGLEVELYRLFEPDQVRSPLVRRLLRAVRGRPGGRFVAHFVADTVLYFRARPDTRTAVLCLLYPLIGPWNSLNRLTRRYAYWYWMPDMIWAKQYVKTSFWRVFGVFARAGLRNCTTILVPTASAHIDVLAFVPKRYHDKIDRLTATFADDYWSGLAATPIDRLAGRRFIFHPAGTKPSKNVWRSIRAFLSIAGEDERFVLLADPSAFRVAAREALGAELSADSRIVPLSFVRDEEMKWLYREAAAVSVASVEEGVGLPILEALHLGRRPIVSACSAMPQTARGEAIFVDPFDERSLAGAYADALRGREPRATYLSAFTTQTVVEDARRLSAHRS
jgi:glycosyltransferase involved in cell wall biosynthesis